LLVNLVVNARDAMPDGGALTVETANVVVDENYRQLHPDAAVGEYVSVIVSDTGCGMDDAALKHLFEPFFTTKEKGKGTGLGLSMVYGIVKQHGGFINVYSEPGVGTTFKACFPLVREEAEAVAARPASALPTGTETVLVVEDEEMVRNLTKKALERFGYRVLAVDGGGDAFLLCRDHAGPIDLLLTDVVLPGMNGRILYENVQPLRPKLKVVFMSGYTEHVIVDRGVLEKGIHFIQKPFTIDTLARKVRQALDA
jgi:CheY-like chemotaxis protein